MLSDKIRDIQKGIIKHNFLMLIGREKTYSEQVQEINEKHMEEVLSAHFKRSSDESCREWISRINELLNGVLLDLDKTIEEFNHIALLGSSLQTILRYASVYYVIPFIEPMLIILNTAAEENHLERNYSEAISRFQSFQSSVNLSLHSLYREACKISSGERLIGDRVWEIFYDVKKVITKYSEYGILEDIQSNELFPPSSGLDWLASILLIAGKLILDGLKENSSEPSEDIPLLSDKDSGKTSVDKS